jgi:hypothetical protein
MNMGRWIVSVLIIFVAAFSIISVVKSSDKEEKNITMDKDHIVLLGASVGQEWDLQDYPRRMKDPKHTFESIAVYQYDKSEGLQEILMRPKRKFRLTKTYLKGFFQPAPKLPGTIIIKECAAYFPGDMDVYKDLVKQWVKRIRSANIEVILATTVPVTRTRAQTKKGQLEQILEFNDWLRSYAGEEHIRILDLEVAVRTNSKDRLLRDDLSTDGLHLNKAAYDILDATLRDALGNR